MGAFCIFAVLKCKKVVLKMKRLRFFLPAVLLSVVVLFSSCLEGETTVPVNYGYFTVKKSTLVPAGVVLVQDMSGFTFIPSAESVKALGGLGDVERAFLEYRFAEGQTVTENTREFYVELVNYGNSFSIQTKDLSMRPDTLRNDSISSFDQMWAYGGYVTTVSNVYYAYGRTYMDMVKERVGNDTLYLRLNQNLNLGQGEYYAVRRAFNSFRLPDAHELEAEEIRLVDDSVVVAVAADIARGMGHETVYQYMKYKPE